MTYQSGGAVSGAAGGVLGGTYPSPTFATNGTTPILGSLSAVLGADVSMTSANTYVDVLSLALTTGTWLVFASVLGLNSSNINDITVKLWDGATVYASTQGTGSVNYAEPMSLLAVIPLAGNTTIKISAACDVLAGKIKAAASANAAGNTATSLIALRIA